MEIKFQQEVLREFCAIVEKELKLDVGNSTHQQPLAALPGREYLTILLVEIVLIVPVVYRFHSKYYRHFYYLSATVKKYN